MPDIWPLDLPQNSLVGGYGEAIADGMLEYVPDAGPTISRQSSSAAAAPLTVNYELTSAQIASLRAFVGATLLGGSLPFLMPAVVGGGTVLVKFQKGGLPSWSALGGDYFSVTMKLWVLP